MNYKNITDGIFRQRLNRFEATVEICGKTETVHVKNTGRCKELLVPGCKAFLERSENPNRKTAYDLTAVEKKREGKPPLLINMDSQIPNAAAEEWLKKGNVFSKNAEIRREVKFENSRFDFYVEDCGKKAFLEVKGVTLGKGRNRPFSRRADDARGKTYKRAYFGKGAGLRLLYSFCDSDEGNKCFYAKSGNSSGIRRCAFEGKRGGG